ncbi:hypothetical protein GE061_019138 [Apolygus lucorum]|uniref:Malate dehydrogenase, mitochondrial n=1 Tax=Apolygus lucorum TaxID=248454 RepID=A0A6A4JEW6_APOLU|nr:hypothetical protein GE061_019138 [Apolygus lucorum]
MKKFQVAVVGINSIFGGTSALLLKQSRFIKCLRLYDQRNVEAAVDLSTINTPCKIKTFLGYDQLESAFEDADIIVISDEGNDAIMSLDSHLMKTAGNYKNYASAIARASPHAIIVVASTPVNCLLPIMSQLLAKHGCYDHNKVLGSTLVDTIRASSMLASHLNLDPKEVVLPVIGGSSERTRVPVFSQSRPFFTLKKDEKTNLIMNIRRSDVQVLANKGSPEVLNRAYSTVRFLNSIMAGLRGDPNVTDITLCRTDQVPGIDYFSLPVILGKEGIAKRFGVPKTTEAEDEMVEEAIKYVKKDADKAAYIVRGAIELPDKKFLSANERASSQKEMFDLYVKCLPKPADNKPRDTMSDYNSQKPQNYSFNKLIKDEPSINPMKVPGSKSFRRMASNRLKNVASEENFLKSTGYFTSPFQNPILILEPMGCPSAPRDLDKHSELEESEGGEREDEDNILHENMLARTGKCGKASSNNTENSNVRMKRVSKSPLSSNEMEHEKTIDPIAKLKEHVADHSRKDVHIRPSRIARASELPSVHKVHDDSSDQYNSKDIVGFDAAQPSTTRRSKRIDKHTKQDDVFAKKIHLTPGFEEKLHSTNKDEDASEKEIRKFVYDFRSDRAMPTRNGYKRDEQSPCPTEKDNGEWQDVVSEDSKHFNLEKEEKYKKLVNRLFSKLDGLKDGGYLPEGYLPLKPSERPKSRSMQSFTESAIRSKSHWTSTGHLYPSKLQNKDKINVTPFETEQDVDYDYYQKNLGFKKTRKTVPRIKSFLSQSTRNTALRSYSKKQSNPENLENAVEDKFETVQVVCPKCQNKIECSPDKKIKSPKLKSLESKTSKRSAENNTENKRDTEVKKVNIAYYGPRPDCNRAHYTDNNRARSYDCEGIDLTAPSSQPVLNSPVTPSKTLRESEIQDERLKKLKEKINQKLIPLMNGSGSPNAKNNSKMVDTRTTPSSSINCLNTCKASCSKNSNDHQPRTGSPFVVGKSDASIQENTRDSKNEEQKVTKAPKWQGIPFVVKTESDKAVRKRKEEKGRTEDLKKNEETCSKQADEHVTANCLYKSIGANKRVTKTTNKLQLLSSNMEIDKQPEIKEKIAELLESENCFKESKQKRKEKLDLKSDEVQCYMQTKIKNRFERSQTLKISTDSKNDDEDAKLSDMFAEMSGSIDKSSSATGSRPTSQTLQEKKVVVVNHVPSGNINIDEPTESENCNEKSSSAESVKRSSTDLAVGEVSLKSDGEKQKSVRIPPSTDSTSVEVEKAQSVDQESGMISSQPFEQNKDTIDKKINSKSQSSKVSRSSLVTLRSDPQSKANSLLQLIVGSPKSASKLQLLAIARENKLNHDSSFSVNSKLQNMWEQTLNVNANPPEWKKFKNSSKSHKNIFEGKLGKRSAAVRIAQNQDLSKPPTYKVRLTHPTVNNTNILDGFAFPCRRRKTKHNMLKKLASSTSLRKPRQKTESTPVRRGRSLDPTNRIHLYKEDSEKKEKGFPTFSRHQEGVFRTRSAEYSRDEDRIAKLASEVMMKRKLTRPPTVGSKWKSSGPDEKFREMRNFQKPRPSSYPSAQNLQEVRASYGIRNDNKREPRARKSADDVQSKLMSMPRVRHQIEHFEMPLGPLEIQPGLAPLIYGKSGQSFPTADNSWESVLYNEYVRSNLLPSLKDTRETFHIEERPL